MISIKTFPVVRSHTPRPMKADPAFEDIKRRFGNTDLSAFAACRELARLPDPITGNQMAQAIIAGAHDKNGRATASELREFQRFAREHPGRLLPDANEVLCIYEHAIAVAGNAGISDSSWKKMVAELNSLVAGAAHRSLDGLDQISGYVSAGAMTKAILTGIRDRDGRSTGTELRQFESWAEENDGRLSPGARKVLEIYRRAATVSLQRGQTGLTSTEFAYLAMRLRAVK